MDHTSKTQVAIAPLHRPQTLTVSPKDALALSQLLALSQAPTAKPSHITVNISHSFNTQTHSQRYSHLEAPKDERASVKLSNLVVPFGFGMWLMAILALITVGGLSND